jgi:ABC-type nitrate/sulfonate/bicarbonate transport system substrate-binding protein
MRRLFSLILAGFSCSLAFAGNATTKPAIKINLCVPYFREEFLTLAAIEAKDHGFFAQHGLDVTIVPVTLSKGVHSHLIKPGTIPPRMMDDFGVADTVATHPGICQFGTSNVERFLTGDNAKARFNTVPLLISSYGETYDTQLVVGANSKITTVSDLKGKRVRMGQAPVRMAMEKILKEGGLTLADINEDYGTPATAVLAKLESGELDAAVTYVPTMPYMLASGKVRVLKSNIVKNYLEGQIPHSLVIGNAAFIGTSGDVTKRLMQALNDSNEFLRRNPSEAVYVLQRHAAELGHGTWNIDKMTAEKAGEFVGKINAVSLYEAPAATRTDTLNQLKNYAELLKQHGLVSQPLDLAVWLGVEAKTSVSSL